MVSAVTKRPIARRGRARRPARRWGRAHEPAWPELADGYDALGWAGLDRKEYDAALAWFARALEVGRTLFPKRIPKSRWWSDSDTRPSLEQLESGEHESLSSLGRAEGITGARVGQVLLMLHLAPEIIVALDVPIERTPEGVTMKLVREIARKRSQATQRRMFEALWPGVLGQPMAAK